MIFKIFSTKNLVKILAFFAQITASFCKNFIITLVFEKNANFFAENWQKTQKILIVTLTPGLADLIAAETEQQRRQALRQLDGGLLKQFEAWRQKIIKITADVEGKSDRSKS
jgi:hypothetical protein